MAQQTIKLNFVNRSNDVNNSSVVIFQMNLKNYLLLGVLFKTVVATIIIPLFTQYYFKCVQVIFMEITRLYLMLMKVKALK
jgi:hypothetical protein